MKRFLTKNGIWVLSAIAAVVVILCIMSAIGNGFLRNPFGTIMKPFRSAGAAVSQWVTGIGDHFDKVEDLQAENEDLRQQIAELEKEIRQQQSDSSENVRLRSLLNLREQRSDLQLEVSTIIDYSSSNWFSAFTLDRGTNCGVAVGNCVIDAYGNLVGVVTEVGLNWCTVTTVIDTGSEIGGLVFRTETPAIAKGSLPLLSQGKLILTYLDDSDTLLNGDLIVTSGLGGYYPSGLPIGTVEEIRTDDSGTNRYAVLIPRTDLHNLVQVFIVTDFTVEG